jgi:hypothetical protein
VHPKGDNGRPVTKRLPVRLAASFLFEIVHDCIGNSDALYHNVEHTMLVTLVGYDIIRGRALLKPTLPGDYAHLFVARLFHDIGYVRGLLHGDDADNYVIDTNGRKIKLPRGSSDAALLPHSR